MSEMVSMIGGPLDGERVPYPRNEGVAIPLDADLNPMQAHGKPFAFAIYKLEDSDSDPVLRFSGVEREDKKESFDVEFVDGPMKGPKAFGQPIQLLGKVTRLPFDTTASKCRVSPA